MVKPARVKKGVDIEYDYVEDLGQVVRREREKLGLSQAELANLVQTKETIIKKIEQGEFNPPLDLVKRLEKVLKTNLLQVVVEESPTFRAEPPPPTYTLEDILKRKREKTG
ncbi:MAG: helix-turn-helix domain-containing protein [Candidatus Caldarchaeum sp.]|uniref:TIGR00270 family protein n=1 Tax=Caldiarchaeum subterraneum TaxID=311458 RepID=A0A7C5LB25_CALS0